MHPKGDRTAWLQGGNAKCVNPGTPPRRPWHLILLGPPGVGKGTVANGLVEHFGACHLSTGDVFRAARKGCDAEASPALQTALDAMRRGELVTDEIVIGIVRDRIGCLHCHHGFLLDGFPRTLDQARTLDILLVGLGVVVDTVVLLDAPDEVIISRLSGRRVCRQCKASWHLQHAPTRVEGICDHCGGELFQRDDDQPDAIRTRLVAYHETAAPLEAFYRAKGSLRVVEASGTPEIVFDRVRAILDGFHPDPTGGVHDLNDAG